MTTDADVIIAGAGPAGSLAAYELAVSGVSVLILEKSEFPRYKVCGAGLTHKIIREIPFDISPVIETRIRHIVFSKGFRDCFTRSSAEPMMYCSNRAQLDDFLLQKAVAEGAKVIHGEKVTEVTQEKDFVTVRTRTGTFRSKLLIGADGASGTVARSAGLRGNITPGLAWEAEVQVDPATVKRLSDTVFLDWGSFPGGYGWVFPKGDHLSIGVGGPAKLAKYMMPYYQKLLGYLAEGDWENGNGPVEKSDAKGEIRNVKFEKRNAKCEVRNAKCKVEVTGTISLKSWPIPVRDKSGRFHSGRVLVAGDAAGLTDPLTGEGIYYAVRSGKLAAQFCREYLSAVSPSLEPYSVAVNDELMTELLEANRIKCLFNTMPGTIHRFVRDNDRGWRAFTKILRGERWYADVPGGFGKWRLLWGSACSIAKQVSGYREVRFSKKGFK